LGATVAHAESSLDKGCGGFTNSSMTSRVDFDAYIKAHPDDPAGYFYLTAVDWWHLAQDIEYNLPDVREQLEADSSARSMSPKSSTTAHRMIRRRRRLASIAAGPKDSGKVACDAPEWVSAYFAGKRGHKYLQKALDLEPHAYRCLPGFGIYDYYTDTFQASKRPWRLSSFMAIVSAA